MSTEPDETTGLYDIPEIHRRLKAVTEGIEIMPPSLYVEVLMLEMLLHIHSQLSGIDTLLEGIASNSNDLWNREFNK